MLRDYVGIEPRVDPSAWVAENAWVIGDVHIGPDSGIWYGCVLRGDVNYIRVGARTNIQDGTVVHVATEGCPTLIGDGVTIGHQALIHACTLEPGCFVGMQACVMDGAIVEQEAMIGAGSLVPGGQRVHAGQLWLGSPARYRRDLSREERAAIIASADRYVRLAHRYRDRRG